MTIGKRGIGSLATVSVAISQIAIQVSSLARYAIVARLVSPSEFGVAALIGGAAQLVEVISSAGADTILVQAQDGDEVLLQRAIHLLRALRGAANAFLLCALAGPISSLFSLGQLQGELRLLALFPFIRGFYHTDCNRLQRHVRFNPWMVAEVVPNVLTTVLVVYLATVWRDHRAILAGVLFQGLAGVILSHLVSERPYRWTYDRATFARFVGYSWPLAANSLLIFAITQGDRFVIGSARAMFGNQSVTLEALGVYSATATLTMAPSVALANIVLSLGLPYLSAAQEVDQEYAFRFQRCLQWILVASIPYVLIFVLLGTEIMLWVTGTAYPESTLLAAALSLSWALRTIRAVPTIGSLGKGNTRNGLYSNIGRLLSLALVFVALANDGNIHQVAIIGVIGEIVAITASFYCLQSNCRHCLTGAGPLLSVGVAIIVSSVLLSQYGTSSIGMIVGVSCMCLALLKYVPLVRRDIHEVFHKY